MIAEAETDNGAGARQKFLRTGTTENSVLVIPGKSVHQAVPKPLKSNLPVFGKLFGRSNPHQVEPQFKSVAGDGLF